MSNVRVTCHSCDQGRGDSLVKYLQQVGSHSHLSTGDICSKLLADSPEGKIASLPQNNQSLVTIPAGTKAWAATKARAATTLALLTQLELSHCCACSTHIHTKS